MRNERVGFGLIVLAVVGTVIVIFSTPMSISIVPAGSVGVLTRWGAVLGVVQPGFNWHAPIGEGVVNMSVQTQKDQVDASAASKDLQAITSTIAINYHLDGQYAVQVYESVGTNYKDILIAPAIQNIFKATTAQYTAEELITQREAVRIKAEAALKDQLAVYHVVVENFNIVNFDFSKEFNAAIEAKQVAQQQVETAKQKLAQAQVDAETALATAKGQADAQAAVKASGSLTPEYLQYLAITKWDGKLPTAVGGSVPFINIPGITQPVTAGASIP